MIISMITVASMNLINISEAKMMTEANGVSITIHNLNNTNFK